MPKAAKNEKTPDSEPAFEDALEQLEDLVREMESDQIPLESLIRKYEEGSRLYKICEDRLDEARGRIEILRKKRNGEHVLEPFGEGAEQSAATAATADSGDPQQDGELF